MLRQMRFITKWYGCWLSLLLNKIVLINMCFIFVWNLRLFEGQHFGSEQNKFDNYECSVGRVKQKKDF